MFQTEGTKINSKDSETMRPRMPGRANETLCIGKQCSVATVGGLNIRSLSMGVL